MLDSGFMPPFVPGTSDRNVEGRGCVVATKGKTAVLMSLLILDRKSTRLNSSHITRSRMPSSAWARVTETSKGDGVLLLLRVKQRC